MSRLNWIIQRSTDADRAIAATGHVGNWRDCHSTAFVQDTLHVPINSDRGIERDTYGNKGFQSKKKARNELERMRKKFPDDSYRLIKITE